MNERDLTYWLKGLFEFNDLEKLTAEETLNLLKGIREHVDLVGEKVTTGTLPKTPQETVTIKLPVLSKPWEDIIADQKQKKEAVAPYPHKDWGAYWKWYYSNKPPQEYTLGPLIC